MKSWLLAACGLTLSGSLLVAAESIPIPTPGLPPSSLDAECCLIEDWGAVRVRLSGDRIVDGTARLQLVQSDEGIPVARATADRGGVRLTASVYRAPIFPAGVDVLEVQIDEIQGQACELTLALELPPGTAAGSRSVSLGGRTVLVLPEEVVNDQPWRAWGYDDQAISLRGWASPAKACDPAFQNIRAGLGGVPIVYRFTVPPQSEASVVLGFCESHWTAPGQRPVRCQVEGADSKTVDAIAQWGRHVPGVVAFAARDANGDGRLDVAVKPSPAAQDANPILNVIWIFPAGQTPPLEDVLAGKANPTATCYVDAGGDQDQSILPPAKLQYAVSLPASGSPQWTFLVASPGGSAVVPGPSTWNLDSLRHAARDVWRDWPVQDRTGGSE